MDEYSVNDWGIATFEFHKKGKRVGLTAFGQITGIEKKVLTFRDDYIEYIIDRKKFTFEKKPEPGEK
jgi:hypothetical protein